MLPSAHSPPSTQGSVGEAYNDLQYCLHDEIDVHRVVLCLARLGDDRPGRQGPGSHPAPPVGSVLRPRAGQSEHRNSKPCCRNCWTNIKLLDKPPGDRRAEDAWVDRLAMTIYTATPDPGGRSRRRGPGRGDLARGRRRGDFAGLEPAGALRPGPCQGRTAGKTVGSVHGNSVGVHASDAANAWRNIARVGNARNTFASLIVAAFQNTVRPEHEACH